MKTEMKLLTLITLSAVLFACGNKEEKPQTENLKPLASIETPKGDAGTYVGALPEGDCDKLQIKMVLDSAAGAIVAETCVQDTITSVTRLATYKDSAGVIVITYTDSPRVLRFKKSDGFSIELLDEAGEVSRDSSGEPYRAMRILNMPGSK